ncbi:MAG TPA: cytochrome c biogenesis protein CcsA [Bryobacteraceae bacterium]|nr:cytochrome c biogenesis protein CcsA [Bryobacteraceae bacterium]
MMRQKVMIALCGLAAILLARNLYVILLKLPDEAAQGAIYRIIFFHLPSWFTSFTAYFLAGVASILYLVKKQDGYDTFAVSVTEIGTVFTAMGLITGMIWARIIWGIWWTWDPRLTWAFICWLIYAGYLMLRRAIEDPTARARNSAVLNIFSFTTVVITYKAIDWWRTQHPAAVLSFRTGGGKIDPAMEAMIFWNWFALMLFAAVLVMIRMHQEQAQRELDALRRHAHAL